MKRKAIQKRAQKILEQLPKDFTAVLLDESFFFSFDTFVKRV